MAIGTGRRKAPAKPGASAPDPFTDPPAQKELEPVVDGKEDEARTAIATINTQLAEFDTVEAGIAELEKKYKDVVFPVDTPKGMREACDARAEINKPIHATEHARKAAKAPVLKLGRDIDARAAKIDTRLRALVKPIADQITAREVAEAERVSALRTRIRDVVDTPSRCIGKTHAQLLEILEGVNTLPLDEFQELRAEAATAQERTRQQVTQMIDQAKLAEEAAELRRQQKAEADRKAAHQLRLRAIGDCLALPYRTAARVQQAIDQLEARVIGEEFEEFAPAARERKAEVLAKMRELHAQKVLAETPAPTPAPIPVAQVIAQDPIARAQLDGDAAAQAVLEPPFGGSPVAQDRLVRGVAEEAARIVGRKGPTGPEALTLSGSMVEVKTGGGENHDAQLAGYEYVFGIRPVTTNDERLLSDHDRINDERGAELVRDFGPAPGGATFDSKTPEVIRPWLERATGGIDPDVVDAEVRQRPTDAELLNVLAQHYDVPLTVVASWLRTLDIDAAAAQQSFVEVPLAR